ncbi:HPr family phosphocarrier protein [Halioxenophilus sp. WMMB6]|uniref:HPr family phosphocarrier protein n=1 Tax=Halioxenophilus sp. WMMB6 TaxID=3073815 RepID=UPI00295EFC1A|nr:HPr family phosphocarrier protein [Halioxenophilus sp. WMMB6]
MLQQAITITNSKGLHARVATKLVKTATQYQANITIVFDGKTADCKSVMSILLLAASCNSEIVLQADGDDEQAAIDEIALLFANKFEEEH